MNTDVRYLVVGGGISGLTAAWELSHQVPGEQVMVLEGSDRTGGKIRGALVGGLSVDVGAESVLARRPEAVDLIREVGLGEELVHPAAASALIRSRGALHPLPKRTLMGVPADTGVLAGLLTPEEVARAREEALPDMSGERADDISVGELIGQRLGRAVVDRLVEPLLGGVYAGHADQTSVAAALPALLAAHREGTSVLEAVDALMPPAPASVSGRATAAPVFAGVRGGLHRLPAVLTERLRERGVEVHSGVVVRELHRNAAAPGWTVTTGPVPTPHQIRAQRVLLAVPAAPAARLLRAEVPGAAQALAGIPSASMAVVTYAAPADAWPGPPGSGVLVPPVEGRTVKASTFSANKWEWVAEQGKGAGPAGQDLVLLRVSVGRYHEEQMLQVDDETLAERCWIDLAGILNTDLPAPLAWGVQRWGGGLPQYLPGHRDRVAQVQHAVTGLEGLAATGAWRDGVGIPACIAAARRAARELLDPAQSG